MAINNINNGESALWVRNILNQVIDKVNDLDKMMSREIVELTGRQDGSNVEFTTAKSYTLGSSELYVNGIKMFIGLDYVELDQDNIEFKSIIPELEDVIVFECVLKH